MIRQWINGPCRTGLFLGLPFWFKKKPDNDKHEIDYLILPLTRHEITVLVRIVLVPPDTEPTADKQLLEVISNRIGRLTKGPGADDEPAVVFIGLRLTFQELLVLTKNLIAICRTAQLGIADKEIVGEVSNRVVRWAERQGAWWDDGHKIITSIAQQID
jgi:hypothetical protein